MTKLKREPFKKELIYFDKKAYNKAREEAERKLYFLDDAISFASEYLNVINIKEFIDLGLSSLSVTPSQIPKIKTKILSLK